MVRVFHDRRDAGKVLAESLSDYTGKDGLLVLGLPRGGVPVACEVAESLGAEMDIFIVKELILAFHQPQSHS